MPRTLSPEDIEEFREQLCAAACRLFAENGTDGVTMRALAEVMGISPMKPYHYFRDKEDILAASITRAFRRFNHAMDEAEKVQGTAQQRSVARREAYVNFALSEPDCYRVMFELPTPDLKKFPELAEEKEKSRARMRRNLDELIEVGAVEGDPILLGYALWSALHGAVSVYLAGKLDSKEQFDAIIDLLDKGLFTGLKPSFD